MNEQQYLETVKNLIELAEYEMKKAEDKSEFNDLHNLALQLPRLISIVNVISYLRGQDGVFEGIKPIMPSNTQELYVIEDTFEKRLNSLIEKVNSDPKSKEVYQQLMKQYYLKARRAE